MSEIQADSRPIKLTVVHNFSNKESQRIEKAVQHVVTFAQFMHRNECADLVDLYEVLIEAAARAWRVKNRVSTRTDGAAEQFGQECSDVFSSGAPLESAQ